MKRFVPRNRSEVRDKLQSNDNLFQKLYDLQDSGFNPDQVAALVDLGLEEMDRALKAGNRYRWHPHLQMFYRKEQGDE